MPSKSAAPCCRRPSRDSVAAARAQVARRGEYGNSRRRFSARNATQPRRQAVRVRLHMPRFYATEKRFLYGEESRRMLLLRYRAALLRESKGVLPLPSEGV